MKRNPKEEIIKNPSLILSDREIMQTLIDFSTKSESTVVDLRDIFIKQMKSDLDQLSKVHKSVLSAAYDNFIGTALLHKAILCLLKETTIESFLDVLITEVTSLLDLTAIRLCILEKATIAPHPAIIKMSREEALEYLNPKEANCVYSVSLRSVPRNTDWFNYKPTKSREIRSEAVLWLQLDEKMGNGILVLASEKKETFLPSMKTDHLKFFSEIFSLQLQNLKKNV